MIVDRSARLTPFGFESCPHGFDNNILDVNALIDVRWGQPWMLIGTFDPTPIHTSSDGARHFTIQDSNPSLPLMVRRRCPLRADRSAGWPRRNSITREVVPALAGGRICPERWKSSRTAVTAETLDAMPDEARSLLLEFRCELAALRVYLALQRLVFSHKAGFNPAQLRIPAGQPGGGQWTDGGGVILIGARGRGSVSVRVGSRTLDATPAQAARYAVANARAEAAAARVREVDPSWRPRPSLSNPGSIESQTRRRESEAREAEARLAELARGRFGDNQGPPLDAVGPRAGTGTPSFSPPEAIGSFRSITGMPDLGSWMLPARKLKAADPKSSRPWQSPSGTTFCSEITNTTICQRRDHFASTTFSWWGS